MYMNLRPDWGKSTKNNVGRLRSSIQERKKKGAWGGHVVYEKQRACWCLNCFEDKAFVLLEIQKDKIKEKQLSAPRTALAITPGRASIPIECDGNSHLENKKE